MKKAMMRISGRTVSFLLMMALLLCAAGGGSGEAAEPDYYQIGLKVTGVMSEIVGSEDFLAMFATNESFERIRKELNTQDYDSPVAVYDVTSDTESMLLQLLLMDPESGKKYNSLSPVLKEQLKSRISIQTLLSGLNARIGADYLAFFNLTTAFVRDESLSGEEARYKLYVFEKGMPVLVSFGYHSADGMFLYIPEESRNTPEAIAAYLNQAGIDAVPASAGET